jgi:hypothetical protein
MKLAVVDANIFIDLIKLQMPGMLFCIELEIFTTQEIIDQLNTSQLIVINDTKMAWKADGHGELITRLVVIISLLWLFPGNS